MSHVYRTSHLSQIISLALLWIFFLIAIIYSFFEPAQLKITLMFGALVLLLSLWNRSLKIRVDESGILYTSGLKNKTLAWADIAGVVIGFEAAGTSLSKNITIRSNNMTKPDIAFNIYYFRQKDIAMLGRIIRDTIPNLPINDDFAKFMKKYNGSL